MLNTNKNLTLLEKEELIQPRVKGISENNAEDIQYFFELFSDDIYNFPVRYFNFSEDDAGEFYLYAFEHLRNGKKIASFKYKSKFTTWLFSVLRNLVIDYLRKNKKSIKISTIYQTDINGITVNIVDNIPDTKSQTSAIHNDELFHNFTQKLNSMKIYNRVLFKLAFIHYINLDQEEIEWLCTNNSLNPQQITGILYHLKELALEKSREVQDIEDKLTANFIAIGSLEIKINNFLKENPPLVRDEKNWSEFYNNPDYPEELNNWIQLLMKKKKKHEAWLQQQKKSMLCTRLPYKEFSNLLGHSEGVLSVQLIRIIEELNSQT